MSIEVVILVDKLDTSDRLLYAAINLIAEKGYKAVSTKEIAKEA
ncbi:TetR family transcriptional regulator, partial [Streptomyces sp. ISL-14]|nr:TetR family transcriptional regulator [Streptomyces sp. ISL-14]